MAFELRRDKNCEAALATPVGSIGIYKSANGLPRFFFVTPAGKSMNLNARQIGNKKK